jgi:hypothetical protein
MAIKLQKAGKSNSRPFSKELNENAKYPFATMRKGDYFFVSGNTQTRQNATSAAAHFSRRNNPSIRFSAETVKAGKFRISRVA